MAVQKSKKSRRRRDERRSQDHHTELTIQTCPMTGKLVRRHQAIRVGREIFYKGQQVY